MENIIFENNYYSKYLKKECRNSDTEYLYKFGEVYIYKDHIKIYKYKLSYINLLLFSIFVFVIFDEYEDILLIIILILFFLIWNNAYYFTTVYLNSQ